MNPATLATLTAEFLLQEKLNRYLAFIESGEVFDRLRDTEIATEVARDTPIRIRILARCVPTEKAVAFLKFATNVFEKAGFELTHEVVGPGHQSRSIPRRLPKETTLGGPR